MLNLVMGRYLHITSSIAIICLTYVPTPDPGFADRCFARSTWMSDPAQRSFSSVEGTDPNPFFWGTESYDGHVSEMKCVA